MIFKSFIDVANVFVLIALLCDVFKYLSRKYVNSYYIILGCYLISFMPLLMTGFYYYDDLWSFKGVGDSHIGIAAQRPFIDLFINIFSPLHIGETAIVRAFFVLLFYANSILFFTWLSKHNCRKWKAMVITVVLSCNVQIVDFVGYISIFPVSFAVLFTMMAFINFEKYSNDVIWRLSKTIIFLISACMYYPIITPLFFSLYVVYLLHYRNNDGKEISSKLLFVIYGVSVGVYYGISRFILILFEVNQSSRAAVLSSIDMLVNKAEWFVVSVLPNVWYHFLSIFVSCIPFTTNCMFYSLRFSNELFYVISGLLALVVLARFLLLYKVYGIKCLISIFLCIPLTFYFWIILSESTILTYYIYPTSFLIGIIVLTVVCSFGLGENIIEKYEKSLCAFFLALVVVANSFYAFKFWNEYNVNGFNYIRNTIASQITADTKKIHIYGKLNPYQINAYTNMATRIILDDLGYDSSCFKITSSDNDRYLTGMTLEEKNNLFDNLSEENKAVFTKYYRKSNEYNVYSFIGGEEIDWNEIKKMFIEGGGLPNVNDKDVIVVDLNKGFVPFYKF